MAESVSMGNNADDEAFRKYWSDFVGNPDIILQGYPSDGDNVMLTYYSTDRYRRNSNNLLDSAADYSGDFSNHRQHHQRSRNANPQG